MRRPMLPLTAAMLLALTACGSGDDGLRESLDAVVGGDVVAGDEGTAPVLVPVDVPTELVDPEGGTVGRALFRDTDNGVQVEVEVSGLTEGIHGMYLHDVGVCGTESAAPDEPGLVGPFLSAGDVVQELPAVLVLANGAGSTTTLFGPVPLEELLEGDGTALVITEAADGRADIPLPPAAPAGPDEPTPAIEDTGSRVACGAIGGGGA